MKDDLNAKAFRVVVFSFYVRVDRYIIMSDIIDVFLQYIIQYMQYKHMIYIYIYIYYIEYSIYIRYII